MLTISMHGTRYCFARLKMFKSNGFSLCGRKKKNKKVDSAKKS